MTKKEKIKPNACLGIKFCNYQHAGKDHQVKKFVLYSYSYSYIQFCESGIIFLIFLILFNEIIVA
jgi:hypothetical protein